MSAPETIFRLMIYATLWVAVLVAVAAIMRKLWMWLFGASAIVQELEALRSEVRDLRKALAPPAETTSRSAPLTRSASSGRVSNTGWGED